MPSPTFILVHGAWSGAWCWRDLIKELDRRGVPWRAMDLPSSRPGAPAATNLTDDANAVAACATEGPVVLVGHSYGGAVITEVAPLVAGLASLIYIAALVPDAGESATDVARTVQVRTELDRAIEFDGDVLRLNAELAPSALYGQCSPEDQRWATAQLTTQTLSSFRSARTSAAVAVPSRYIKCLSDHAVDPSLQSVLAARCDELVELESDHSPFLSHPSELADALLS